MAPVVPVVVPVIAAVQCCSQHAFPAGIIFQHVGYAISLKKNLRKLNKEAEDLFKRRNDVNEEIEREQLIKKATDVCRNWLKDVGETEKDVKKLMSKVKSTWFPDLDLGNRQRGNEEENSTEQVKDTEKNGRSRCSDLDLGNRQRGNDEENSTEQVKDTEKNGRSRCSDLDLGNRQRGNEKENSTKQVKDNEKNGRSRRGCCLFNICLRYKYGKRLVERKKEIEKLREKGNFQGGAVTNRVSRVQLIPAQRLEEETSMYYTLLRLQKCICDDSFRIIGVWGMPGVGKTTLLENLNNVRALESLFKIIIFVTVSQKWSPEEVRGKIARRLGLDIERETVETARSMVFEKMKDMKYLLILDGVWEKVNLHQIGVPMNNDNTKGKLVLASRFLGVCQGMNTEEDIEVKPLKRQEAWKLFVEKVGEIPSDIEPVAKDVVDQCGNLPIAILAVGGQLRGKQGIQIWNNKLKELCSPSNTDIGLNDDVTKLLKLSYDYLPEERLQRCFLYCALFPVGHDIYVDYLIQCWKGEGLLTYNRSFADAHNEGHTILDKLIDCSLLVKSSRPEYVRMHEMSRHMALKIMQQSLVKAGWGLTRPPETTEWEEGIQKVSLMYNKLSHLPEQPNCNQLSTLFLQFNMELKSIPDKFFVFMNRLRVLDLSETQIRVLPKSLSNLSTLQDLYLENCIHLTSLPAGVGETLEKLELLDIRGTGIRRLPNEIGEFPRLRCLHMSSTSFYINIEGGLQIPRDLIRRDKLEELIVDSEGDPAWDEKAQAVIDELVKLTGLNALRFIFPDVACLESFITWSQSWRGQGWRSFQFDIGHHYGKQPDGGYSIGRRDGLLRFYGGISIPQAVVQAIVRADAFELVAHSTVHGLSDFDMQNMNNLKSCRVQECEKMRYIFEGDSGKLPSLEELKLAKLLSLKDVWKVPVPSGVLMNLKILHIRECPLTKVFSAAVTQQLRKLQELRVESCVQMVGIIEEQEIVEEQAGCEIELGLKILILVGLKNLACICKNGRLRSLERLEVSGCPSLKELPLGQYNLGSLVEIRGERIWWEDLTWENDKVKESFQRRCYLA